MTPFVAGAYLFIAIERTQVDDFLTKNPHLRAYVLAGFDENFTALTNSTDGFECAGGVGVPENIAGRKCPQKKKIR
jgi:hypothetical protein